MGIMVVMDMLDYWRAVIESIEDDARLLRRLIQAYEKAKKA